MKDRNLILTPLYLDRFVEGFSTLGLEDNLTTRFSKGGRGGRAIRKRLTLLLTLAFLLTAAPFLTAHGYGTLAPPAEPPEGATSLASQAQANGPEDKFHRVSRPIPGQYIVVLKKDLGGRDVESITNELTGRHGGSAKHVYQDAIKGFSVQMTEAAAIGLSRDPQVEYVEEDGEVSFATTQANPTWGLDRIDQRNLPLSNTYGYCNVNTGAGVHVYVIDSGIQTTHQEFQTATGGTRAVRDVDFVNDGQNGNDCNGHGTLVAGIIGGNTFGVAKGVTLHSVRVGGCGNSISTSTVIAGINWVTGHRQRPAVANMSLTTGIDYSLEDAVRGAIAAGVTMVVPAGNNNVDAKDTSPARVSVALLGSENQEAHVDYQHPLFAEVPDLLLPPYILVVSFGLARLTRAHGPIQIAPGTHRMSREAAVRAVRSAEIEMQSVPLEMGDVLIRHPWALHRGTPNETNTPRALVSIRYVRRWYADYSREVNTVPRSVWQSLTTAQQSMMRFPIGD